MTYCCIFFTLLLLILHPKQNWIDIQKSFLITFMKYHYHFVYENKCFRALPTNQPLKYWKPLNMKTVSMLNANYMDISWKKKEKTIWYKKTQLRNICSIFTIKLVAIDIGLPWDTQVACSTTPLIPLVLL